MAPGAAVERSYSHNPGLTSRLATQPESNQSPCPIFAPPRGPHGQVLVRGVVEREGGKPRTRRSMSRFQFLGEGPYRKFVIMVPGGGLEGLRPIDNTQLIENI